MSYMDTSNSNFKICILLRGQYIAFKLYYDSIEEIMI